MSAQPPLPEPGTTAPMSQPIAPSSADTTVWEAPAEPAHTSATSTAPGVAFADATGRPSRRRLGLVAGGALALVGIAAATSLAASPAPTTPNTTTNGTPGTGNDGRQPKFPGLDGFRQRGGGEIELRQITISAISGDQVTLGTADGWRRTITLSSSVKVTKGGQPVAASDLKVGDQVRFQQTRNSDGTFTVTDLAVVVPSVAGKVSGVTSSGFKLTTRDGSVWTIATNGSTKVSVGQADGSLGDVKDGDTVAVAGTTSADNAMTALSVRVAPDRALGTVTAKTADSITIKLRDGSSRVIRVDAKTTFRVAGKTDAKLSDVTVGMVLGASGRSRSDGSIDADIVGAGTFRGFGKGNGNGDGNGKGNGFDKRFFGPAFVLPDVFGPTDDDGADAPSA